MPQHDSPVAAAVRAELARAGVGGRQLARDLGWKPGYTARRLRGEVQFRVDELGRIADHLGIPATRFMEDRPEASVATTAQPTAKASV